MTRRTSRLLTALGCVIIGIGLVGAVILQLQPWRTCPDDSSPAACPMLPADYHLFLAFVLVLLAGVVVLLVEAAIRLKARPHQRYSAAGIPSPPGDDVLVHGSRDG